MGCSGQRKLRAEDSMSPWSWEMELALACLLTWAVLVWVYNFGGLIPIHPSCALNKEAWVR